MGTHPLTCNMSASFQSYMTTIELCDESYCNVSCKTAKGFNLIKCKICMWLHVSCLCNVYLLSTDSYCVAHTKWMVLYFLNVLCILKFCDRSYIWWRVTSFLSTLTCQKTFISGQHFPSQYKFLISCQTTLITVCLLMFFVNFVIFCQTFDGIMEFLM